MPVEDMKPITMFADITGYFASTDGFVYSSKTGRIHKLATYRAKDGYLAVVLYCGGRQVRRVLHRIIATTFHGKRPDGMVCRHLNGNKLDNRPWNLAWGTVKENIDDIKAHGNLYVGQKHHLATLSDAEVESVKVAIVIHQRSLTEVAEAFGITKSSVFKIMVGGSRATIRPDLTDAYNRSHKKPNVKLPRGLLDAAIARIANGESRASIAIEYGVNPNYFSRIINGKRRVSC